MVGPASVLTGFFSCKSLLGAGFGGLSDASEGLTKASGGKTRTGDLLLFSSGDVVPDSLLLLVVLLWEGKSLRGRGFGTGALSETGGLFSLGRDVALIFVALLARGMGFGAPSSGNNLTGGFSALTGDVPLTWGDVVLLGNTTAGPVIQYVYVSTIINNCINYS